MATGERIRFFRTLRGMTQKYLGLLLGFPESSADVRLAQYESEDRTPKAELTGQMAEALDVSPKAIAVPDIDTMDIDAYETPVLFRGRMLMAQDSTIRTIPQHWIKRQKKVEWALLKR